MGFFSENVGFVGGGRICQVFECYFFFVLILKKSGVEYLRDFRLISLVGNLYKLFG